jgi:hypothetical protein
MNEKYIKAIHVKYGDSTLGSYEDFYSEITSNKKYRDFVYEELGGKSVFGEKGDFDYLVSNNQNEVKKKEEPFSPLEARTISEEPTQPSETPSENTEEEQLSTEEQEKIVTSGTRANRVLEDVGELISDVTEFQRSKEEVPSLEEVAEIASEWGPTSFNQGATTTENIKSRNIFLERSLLNDDENAYTQKKLKELKPKLDTEYQNLTGQDSEEFVILQENGTYAIAPNALNEVEFESEKYKDFYKDVVEKREKEYEDSYWATRRAGELGAGVKNLYNVMGWFDPEGVNLNSTLNDAKLRGIKKASGMSDEAIDAGIVKNFANGDIEDGLTNLLSGVVSNLPQVGVAVGASMMGAPNVGAALLGATAGGQKYAELYNNPNIPTAMKMLIAAEVGAVELVTEKLGVGDIRLAQQALKNLGKQGRKEVALKVTKNFLKEVNIPIKAGKEELIEESIAAANEQLMDNIVEGKNEFDFYDVADAGLIAFGSGYGVGTANLISKMPSYVGSYKTANQRRVIIDKMNALREVEKDPNATDQEVSIAREAVEEAKKKLVTLGAEDDALYQNMTEEDVNEVIKLNRRIRRGLDVLDQTENKTVRQTLKDRVQDDFDKKKAIEQKYAEKEQATQETTEEAVQEEAPVEEAPVEEEITAEEEVVEENEEVSFAQDEIDALEKEVAKADRKKRDSEQKPTNPRPKQVKSPDQQKPIFALDLIGEKMVNEKGELGTIKEENGGVIWESEDGTQIIDGGGSQNVDKVTIDDMKLSYPETEITDPVNLTQGEEAPVAEPRMNQQRREELEVMSEIEFEEAQKKADEDVKKFEDELANEVVRESEAENRLLFTLNGSRYAVSQKADGSFTVSKESNDGKFSAEKGQENRDAAINEFKKLKEGKDAERLKIAEELAAEYKKEQDDKIEALLDKLIALTSSNGRLYDVGLGIFLSSMNSSLRIAKAAYKAGKTLAESIQKGIDYLKAQGHDVDEVEYKRYILKNGFTEQEEPKEKQSSNKPPKGKATPSSKPTPTKTTQKKATTSTAKKATPKKKGLIAKGLKTLIDINKKLWGLGDEQSKATAIIQDRIVGNMAKRAVVYKEKGKEKWGIFEKKNSDGTVRVNVGTPNNPIYKDVKASNIGVSKQKMHSMIRFEKASEEDLPQGVKLQVDAFHGSPYQFDKFFTEKIGSGEGAQAFGWGLYFTDLESIARGYAEKLGRGKGLNNRGILNTIFKINVKDYFDDVSYNMSKDENLFFAIKDDFSNVKELTDDEVIVEISNVIYGTPNRELSKKVIDTINQNKDLLKEKIPRSVLYKVSLHKGKTPITSDNYSVLGALIIPKKDPNMSYEEYSEKARVGEIKPLKKFKTKEEAKQWLEEQDKKAEYTWLVWDKPMSKKIIDRVIDGIISEGHIQKLKDNYLPVKRELGAKWNQGKNEVELIKKVLEDSFYRYNYGGKKLQEFLKKNVFDNYKDVSMFLLRNGIDGVKYPAESLTRNTTSDNAKGFNYVVFDENAVTIEEVIKFQKDANKARGAMMMGMDGQATIYALTDPNVSTPLHELAHVYEHYLSQAERNKILKWAGHSTWTTKTSEKFARGFEKYLSEGVSPTSTLNRVFEKFKIWLTDIYNGIKNSDIDIELNEEMKSIYSLMIDTSDANYITQIAKDQTVLDAMPYLEDFDGVGYSEANLNFIRGVIENFIETGVLFGNGKVRAIIEAHVGIKNQAKKPPAPLEPKVTSKVLGNVKSLLSTMFANPKKSIDVLVGMGYTGKRGFQQMMKDAAQLGNDWISTVRESIDKNLVNGKKSELAIQIVSYIEQKVNDIAENSSLEESTIVGIVLDNMRHSANVILEYSNGNTNDVKIANTLIEVLAKFDGVTTLSDAMSKLSSKEKNLLEDVYKANSFGLQDKIKISNENGVEFNPIDRYVNMAIRNKSTEEDSKRTAEELVNDPNYMGRVELFGKEEISEKKSGAQKNRKDVDYKLKEGEHYDLNFFQSQLRSFNNTNTAIFTLQSVVQMNNYMKAKDGSGSPYAMKVFGTNKGMAISNIETLTDVVNHEFNSQNATALATYKLATEYSVKTAIGTLSLNQLARLGRSYAIFRVMTSAAQIPKQSAVYQNVVFHLINLVGFSGAAGIMSRNIFLMGDYFSKGIENSPWSGLLNESAESLRDILETIGQGAESDTNIAKRVGWLRKGMTSLSDKTMYIFVKAMDKAAAQISFLNLYEAYMIKNGLVDNSVFADRASYDAWWVEQGKNPNYKAIAFASTLVSKDQNASAAWEKSKLQTDDTAVKKMVKSLIVPLINFKLSKVHSIQSDILIATSPKVSSEDRKDAAIRWAGTSAEVALFTFISLLPIRDWFLSLINDDDEAERFQEDDLGKKIRKQKVFWTRFITESLGITGIDKSVQNLVAEGFNYMSYLLLSADDEFNEKYPTYKIYIDSDAAPAAVETYNQKWWEKAGYIGIAAGIGIDTGEMWEAALTGKSKDFYGNEIYYTESQKRNMRIYAIMASFGVLTPFGNAADLIFTAKKGASKVNRYAYKSYEAQVLANAIKDGGIIEISENYIEDLKKEFAEEYGDLGIRRMSTKIRSGINEFSDRKRLQAVFAAAQNKEFADQGKISDFLVGVSKSRGSSRSKANRIHKRLGQIVGLEERKQFLREALFSSKELYDIKTSKEIITNLDDMLKDGELGVSLNNMKKRYNQDEL